MADDNVSPAAAEPGDVKEKKGIQSVEVGVRVIDALAGAPHQLPLREIGRLAGISASQAHRYLTSFQKSGVVVQDVASGHYGLGTRALRWGVAAMSQTDLFTLSSEALDRICEQFDMTGLLCVWGEYGPTCVRLKRSTFLTGTDLGLGSVFPLISSASGMVFLAHLPRAITEPLIKTERERARKRGEPPVDMAAIKRRCALIRREGYSLGLGHYVSNISAMAAPILDYQGNVSAVITLIFRDDPGVSDPTDRAARIAVLLDETQGVSRSVGWQPSVEDGAPDETAPPRRGARRAVVS